MTFNSNPNRIKPLVYAILAIVFIAKIAPMLAPYPPDAMINPGENHLAAPSLTHWFGTDQLGRDVLSRVLHGGQISLLIGLSVCILALAIGTIYGAIAALYGGWLDRIMMRLVDIFLSFPLLYLAATVVALFGPGRQGLIIILALGGWMDIARLVRSELSYLKQSAFVLRAQASGLSLARILLTHMLPNLYSLIIAASVLRLAEIILIESTLSFLGFGVQPPTASWGTILNDGRSLINSAWWISFFPGAAILCTTMMLNYFGEKLESNNPSLLWNHS